MLRGRSLKLRAKLEGLDFGGSEIAGLIIERFMEPVEPVAISKSSAGIPLNVALVQNYPNPFNPSTSIVYHIPRDARVTIKIYDVLGREIETLLDSFVSAGSHEAMFDGKDFATGVYFYRLEVEETTLIKKMLLLK
jgi:hypothetical protein